MKKVALSIVLGTITLNLFAQGLDLASARKNKQICEGSDGYVHATTNPPSDDVRNLIDNVNKSRKTEYQSIADKTSGKISETEKVAGEKLMKENGGC